MVSYGSIVIYRNTEIEVVAIGIGIPGTTADTCFFGSSFFGSSFFGSIGAGIVAGVAITPTAGAHPAGAVAHPPQDAATCGEAHTSQLREPWNLARNRASRPTLSHGSAQLVVNPVNSGLPHVGVHET